jgi:hypothetical protein
VAPLKAAEFHRLARQELSPTLDALGFKRIPKTSVASWARPEGNRWLVMWLQPSQSNDPFGPGFKFTVELALSSRPEAGLEGYRERLPTLLTHAQREDLRHLENRAISKLPPPDREYAILLGPLREWWLAGWKPRLTPYEDAEDIWFRHGDEADLLSLMAFFALALPAAIDRFLTTASKAR